MKPELMIPVEIAVRGIPCSHDRKMRMREELYSLIEARHADLVRNGMSEEAAIRAAREAFGDPLQIREELLLTVPRWERAANGKSPWLLGEAGPVELPFSGRMSAALGVRGGLLLLAGLLLPGLLLFLIGHPNGALFWNMWLFWISIGVFFGLNMFAISWIGSRAVRESLTENPVQRENRWLILGGLACGLVFFASSLLLDAGAGLESMHWTRKLIVVPAVQGIFCLVVQLSARERRAARPWDSLDVSAIE